MGKGFKSILLIALMKPSGNYKEAEVLPFARIAFATEVKSAAFTL